MQPFDFFILTLALWEILEIWRHGELFADWRAELELRDAWWARLLSCGFCLAPWAAWWLLACLALDHYGPPWVRQVDWLLLQGFALARAANVLNDLLYARCRTPRDIETGHTFEPEEEP